MAKPGWHKHKKPFTLALLLLVAVPLLTLALLPLPALAQTSITTCTELQNIRSDLTGDYYLANDINCSGFGNFEPIGNWSSKFTGTFDGKGYKITNLYINRGVTRVGLFGVTDLGSEIKDVSLEEVNVTASQQVGGLVGLNWYGTITNSSSSGSVTGSASYVGGLVGRNYEGTITNSSSSGSVTASDNYVGGLVGENTETITNSYSSGSVTGSSEVGGLVGLNTGTITNSYSSGSVTGGGNVGGLVGRNTATITNSYYDTNTSGQSDTGKGDPKTTAEMKQQATFSGWDFDTVWAIVEHVTYPYLQWQPEPLCITSFAPPSPVNDTVCTWRTFNVTVNQEVNVSWYLNNSLLHTNQSVTEANYTLHAEFVGDNNVSAKAENANGTAMQEWVWNVTGPTLELGGVTGITEDWGMNFNLNHSVTVTNANASNVNVAYNVSWLTTQSLGTVNRNEKEWANQTVSNSTVQNITVRANANTTNASAVNDSETFWINVTRRDVTAEMLSSTTQSVNVNETFNVNASAVDEYGEDFTDNASLIREGTTIDTLTGITKYANFTTNVSTSGTYNFSVLFFNTSYYNNATTINTTITVYEPTAPASSRPRGGGRKQPVLPAGVTTVLSEPTGKVASSVTASSADKKAVAAIPAGAIAKDAAGNPLTQIKIVPPQILPAAVPSGTEYGGYAYNFGPTGATFNPPIEIRITFDPAKCGCPTPVIYTYYEEGWNRLDTTAVGNTATAKVNHFSTHILCCDLELETPTPTLMPSPAPTPTLISTPAAPAPKVPKFLVLIVIVVIVIAGIIAIVLKRK